MKFKFLIIIFLLSHLYIQAQEVVTDTIYQDVIIEYDTIYAIPDTVEFIDTHIVYIEPMKMNYNALGFSTSFLLGSTKYSGKTDASTDDIMNASSTRMLAYSLNFDYIKVKNNLLYNGGIELLSFSEKFVFDDATYLTESHEYTRLDTIDERYQVTETDTIWEYVTQLNTYAEFDSTLILSPYNNKYTVISIPISFGYVIPMYTHEFYVKGALSPSILIGNKNNIVAGEEEQWRFQRSVDLLTFNLSYSLELGLIYPLQEKLFVTAGLHFRRSITSFYSEDSRLKLKPTNWGVKLGVQYRL